MNKSIRYADMECLLLRLGIQCGQTTGTHFYYTHPETKALLVFPPYQAEESVQALPLKTLSRRIRR